MGTDAVPAVEVEHISDDGLAGLCGKSLILAGVALAGRTRTGE